MMRVGLALMATLWLCGCDGTGGAEPVDSGANTAGAVETAAANAITPVDAGPVAVPSSDAGWTLAASGEGIALRLADAEGALRLSLFCPAGREMLAVTVPAFVAVASEERMTFGAGTTVATLVADPAGEVARGGVSGEGPVPADLARILASPIGIAVNYGAQNLGPLAPVSERDAQALLAGCADQAT